MIKHRFSLEKTISETEKSSKNYYRDSVPSHRIVHKWFAGFRYSHTNPTNAERSGYSVEITAKEMVNKIHDIV